ncbi:helix-turn-helix transcriptional regulator [Paenibacillus filicis]|uniref:Helix-turn-helix transcriptional regulator n=1 Tax=Paenibacillus gyeongsangnamensis TaxID=3388067 RepID=A0ABT4QA12_9BACL|nr:helix-turn-helix transcriptional regulator [Paenibacillus filicis]MCZ8513505.1 helix-turn-helix transcriptional regulator [Paenibacillus filicis]
MSTYHLCHLFRKATGSSIRDELTARRVKAAALLLATTELPVCAIAEQVGMPNGAHFSTVFRKRLGVSPSQYRRRMRNA